VSTNKILSIKARDIYGFEQEMVNSNDQCGCLFVVSRPSQGAKNFLPNELRCLGGAVKREVDWDALDRDLVSDLNTGAAV
jgi:hypothetical protein